jgi:uncharacterized membrane protein
MDALKELFSGENKQKILSAIEKAEKNTSGEIRLHVDSTCSIEVLDQAAYIFKKLEMHKTAQRNGVLFYLAVKDRKVAVLGDTGINAVVPANFWDEIIELMTREFKKGQFIEGLAQGIEKAGKQLQAHFPYASNDQNELSNEISIGK